MHDGKHHHGNGHHHRHHHHYDEPTHEPHDAGHNLPPRPHAVAQWQTPHAPDAPREVESDLDLVEQAFLEGFAAASDATSFLRLAKVPFEGGDAAGRRLVLLRVETDAVTDVGSVTPHLGGASFRYDALPGRLVSRRRRLRFVYFNGEQVRALTLAEARGLGEP